MNLALNREIRNFGEKVMGKDVGEIVVYQPDDTISLEVKVEDEMSGSIESSWLFCSEET